MQGDIISNNNKMLKAFDNVNSLLCGEAYKYKESLLATLYTLFAFVNSPDCRH